MRTEIANWFEQAKADLKTAKDNITTQNFYAAAFFAQQTAEKVLKGLFMFLKDEEPPKTHNIFDLTLKLKLPERFVKIAQELTPIYTFSRYPDVTVDIPARLYSENKAKQFVEWAEEILKWAEGKLKS